MYFKRLFLITSSFILVHLLSAQSTFEWKHLGPFTTPISTSEEGQWSSTGMGWIESLYVSDDLKTIYAGTITSGLFKSTDGGQTWKIIKQNDLQYGVLDLDVRRRKLYAGLGLTHYDVKFGNRMIYSKNKGRSWIDKNDSTTYERSACWGVAALTSKCVVLAEEDKLLKTENRGRSYRVVLNSTKEQALVFRQLIRSEHDKKTLYASGNVLLRSVDAGDSWQDLSLGLSVNMEFKGKNAEKSDIERYQALRIQRIALAEDPNADGRLLALYSYDHKTYIDESIDHGKTWQNIYKSHRIQRIDINHAEIGIAPGSSNTVLVGGVHAYLSKDGGRSFDQITSPQYLKKNFVHDDIRSMVLKDSNTFFLGTDGGVVGSYDGGESWHNLNGEGLTAMMIYGLGLLDTGFIVGCQDLGVLSYDSNGWKHIGFLYGDGGDAIYNGKIHTILGGRYRMLKADPISVSVYKAPRNRKYPFTSKLYIHPSDSSKFYLVSDHLWFYNGKSWDNLTSSIDNHGYKATDLDINPTDPEVMYFSFDQASWGVKDVQKLVKTTDGGESWDDITPNLGILDWKYVNGIATDALNSDKVYVCLGDLDITTDIHKVYKSEDGGQNWLNWSEGLPPYQCFKIITIAGTSGVLVSNVKGLYYRNDTMDQWQFVSEALPNVAIRDFEIDLKNNQLIAATYGNGVWVLNLPQEWMSAR